MKKNLKTLVIGLATIFLLVGCVPSLKDSSHSKKDNAADNAQTGKVIESSNGKFEVGGQSGWQKTEPKDLNKEADVAATNKNKDMYFVALMEKKTDYEDMDLTEYSEKVLDMEEYRTDEIHVNAKKVKIGKNPAYAYEMYTKNEGNEKIYLQLYVIKTKHYYGQLLVWTSKENKSENKEAMKDFVDTFKEAE